MTALTKADLPATSLIAPFLAGADFFDAYAAPLADPSLTPAEIFLRASRATPDWVSRLMKIRNAIARAIGLKDVGAMREGSRKPAAAYRVGDRLGVFSVFDQTDSELLLGIDDSHLDVRVCVIKPANGARRYIVATGVRIHNWVGRVYMIPVGRIHPFVVRAMMRRAVV